MRTSFVGPAKLQFRLLFAWLALAMGCSLITPLDFVGNGAKSFDAGLGGSSIHTGGLSGVGGEGGGSVGGNGGTSIGGNTNCSTTLFMTDSSNCGACGHDCLGGQCQSGVCQPVVIATGLSAVQDIALDTDTIYVTRWNSPETNGQVIKLPKSGGLSSVLTQGQLNPLGIALDSANVYWANYGPQNGTTTSATGGVAKIAKSDLGGTATVIDSGQSSNSHGSIVVTVDSSNIYWGNYFQIMICPLAGCGTAGATILSQAGGVNAIAVSGGVVYWTNGDGMQVSMIANTNIGGAATPLASNQGRPLGLALDNTYVYWANTTEGTVHRAPLAGGPNQIVASNQVGDSSTDMASYLAIDDTFVYWNDQTAHSYLKAPKSGGGPVTPLTNYGGSDCRYLAVDSVAVYFTCYYAGNVQKIAK